MKIIRILTDRVSRFSLALRSGDELYQRLSPQVPLPGSDLTTNRYHKKIAPVLPSKVNKRVEGRLMMCENYSYSTPGFGKKIYNALLSDGSIQSVAENEAAFNKWKTGD